MTVIELVDNRIGIFERPRTKRKIVRDRKKITIERLEDIIPAHEQRKEDEVLIISPLVDLIPIDREGKPQYYSSQNFSKRGPYLRIPTYGIAESKERKWSSIKARIEASLNPRIKQENRNNPGWSWTDPEGYRHFVQPWMVLEGRRLEMYSLKSSDINNKIKIKKEYTAKDSNLRSVLVEVPSRSGKAKHNVLLEHLTSPTNPDRFVEWMRFRTRHECGFKMGDFTFAEKKIVTYCPHDVAAHVAYSRRIAEQTGRIIDQPFPLFSEPTLRLHLSLIYDTLKVDRTTEGKIKSRPLSFPEISIVLMHAWKTLGNKATFYNGSPNKGYKQMRDYNWQNSAAGIPFKKSKSLCV